MQPVAGHVARGLGRRGFAAAAMLSLGACTPANLLNALAPQRLAASGLSYGPHPRQRLDVYQPDGLGPHPVVMFVYGGRWEEGRRAMYRFVGGTFAAHGFTTVIADYRVYPEVRFPDFLFDCAAAFAWTRAHAGRFGGDATAPWLIGHSAGAYNVAMLTLDPRYLDAAGLTPGRDLRGMIGIAGPYDFLPIEDPVLKTIFGAPPSGMADPRTQPITFAGGGSPPVLLLAGAKDVTVKPDNTLRLAERMRAQGSPVTARIYPGVDHTEIIGAVSPALRFLAPTLRDCLAFMGGPSSRAG